MERQVESRPSSRLIKNWPFNSYPNPALPESGTPTPCQFVESTCSPPFTRAARSTLPDFQLSFFELHSTLYLTAKNFQLSRNSTSKQSFMVNRQPSPAFQRCISTPKLAARATCNNK